MAEVLNLKMDNIGTPGTFIDSSPSGHTITTEGDATQIATALTNRRTGFFFDGDSDSIKIPDSADWDLFADNTQDITVDFFVKHRTHASRMGYLAQMEDCSGTYWTFENNPGSFCNFDWYYGATLYASLQGPAIADTDWHHICLVKKAISGPSANYGFYIDGVQYGFVTESFECTMAFELSVGYMNYSSVYMDGHMKNVRIQYSNVFDASPNVGNTDTITVPTVNPVSDANTKLLLLADAPAQLNSPLGSTAYLDGTGDYLSVPDSAEWDFAANADFTIEGWFRWGTLGADSLIGNGRTDGWNLYYDNAGTWSFYMDGSARETGTFTPLVSTWYHVAVVRSSDIIKIYINGTALDAGTSYGTAVTSGQALEIGDDPQTSAPFLGNIKEVRISDSARYTVDFAPSTTPFVDDGNTLLLLHLNGVPDDTDDTNGWLTDSTGTHTVTAEGDCTCQFIEDYRNRTVVDSGNTGHHGTMFGTTKLDWITVGGNGAGLFDGTGDYLTIPSSTDFDMSTGAFTVGFWVRFITTTTSDYMLGGAQGNNFDVWTSEGKLYVTLQGTSYNFVWGIALGQWYYVEVTRSGTDLRGFINGSQSGAAQTSSDSIDTTGLYIGIQYDLSWPLNAHLDEFGINKGTAAHTIPFIPPTYLVGDGKAFQSIVF